MTTTPDTSVEETPTVHWADHAAEELIRRHPDKDPLVCAAGISPSGTVHIGNFREVITVDFVVRALRNRGRQVRFLYSWDDYDALRKIPKNLPNEKSLEPHLRKPISAIPDPFGKEASYAAHFEKRFEEELEPMGIDPQFIRQNEVYRSCTYHQAIQHALAHQSEIREILSAARTRPLPEDWTCLSIFCKKCNKDATTLKQYEAPTLVHYFCKICQEDFTTDFSKEGGIKLLWRVDWPMRWAHEGVDFEPGGKDHSSQGGSYETGAEIIRKVWKKEPPYYVQYDFVLVKGLGAKISSSSGQVVTLSQTLAVYEPPLFRWLFASRKANLDFSIAFDLDVMKAYDDFDRTERIALGMEEAEPKKFHYERRIYELSIVDPKALEQKAPTQFPFRHLSNILQIHQGDIEKAKAYYADQITNDWDEARYYARAKRAWYWINEYAPEAFRFTLRDDSNPPPKTQFPATVKEVVALLKGTPPTDEEKLAQAIYDIVKANNVQPKIFFQEVYSILFNKTKGPKLASFFLTIGPAKAAAFLERSL